MPCNCCGNLGCFCHINDSSQENGISVISGTARGYGVEGSAAGYAFPTFYWIHRPYPVPISSCTYNSKIGSYIASNAVFNITEDGCVDFTYPGDYHFYTRSGVGWVTYRGTSNPSLLVEHWDGDSSYGGTFIYPENGFDVTYIEFRSVSDNVQKKCILYSRAKTGNSNDPNIYTFTDPEEGWQLIHSKDYSKIGNLGNIVVTLPYAFGGGVTSVDLIFRCGMAAMSNCIAETSGNADYVNGPVFCGQQPCDRNHGSYNGTFKITYLSNEENPCFIGYDVTNIATFFSGFIRIGVYYLTWFPERYVNVGADCIVSFFISGNIDGDDPQQCFGKRYGIYKNPDGTITIGDILNFNGYSYFSNDPFVLNVTSLDQISFSGIWVNGVKKQEWVYDCAFFGQCNFLVKQDPWEEYAIGTVVATRT